MAIASTVPIAATPVAAGRVIHVAPGGRDAGTGDATDPVRTVARAVQLAADGDVVQIESGTYHESVQVYRKQVHLQAAPGASVILDGAVEVGGWSSSGGDWSAPWNTDFERAGTPHVTADRPEAGWPEQFFLDGEQLVEVTARSAVVPGTFFHDPGADRVWIGDDPTGRLVEGSDLPWAIYLNHAHGSSLHGITVRRYATPVSKMAAVRAYADDLVIDGLTVADNAYMGLSMIGQRIDVSDTTARDNGHLGMHAHRSAEVSVTGATIVDNNRERFDAWHAAGGMKVTSTAGLTVTDTYVAGNGGPGLWTDLGVSDVRLARNVIRDNMRSGIELELSSDAIVVDNTVVDNGESGVWVLESQQVQIWHNALFGNRRDVWIEDGPRSDVVDVDVYANSLGGSSGAPALLNVDDWTEQRSAADMAVAADHNVYWLPPGSSTPYVSRWANWPQPLALSATIEAHRAATGQDSAGALSRAVTNPYVRDPSRGDHRQPAGAATTLAMPADVAALAGVTGGTAFPAGPLTVRGAGAPPAPEPTPPPTTSPPTDPAPTTPSAAVTAGAAAQPVGPGRTARAAVRVGPPTPAATEARASPAAESVAVAPEPVPVAGWRALATVVESGP